MMTRTREETKEYYDKILRPHWSAYQQQQQQKQKWHVEETHRPFGRQVNNRPIHNPLPILSAKLFGDLFDNNEDDDNSNTNNNTKDEAVTKIRKRNEQDADEFCNQNTNSTTNNTNNTTKVEQLKQKKKYLEDKFITLFELILDGPPPQQQQRHDWWEKREIGEAKNGPDTNDQINADTRVRSHDPKNTDTNTDQDQNTTATSTTAATSRCRSSCFSVSSSSSSSSAVYTLPTAHTSPNLEGNMAASTRSVIHLNQQRDTYYQTYHRCRRHNQSMYYHPPTIIGSKRNNHNDCRSNKRNDDDNVTVPTCIAIHCGFTNTNDGLKKDDDDDDATPSIITDSNRIEKHSTNNNTTSETHCSIRSRGKNSDICPSRVRNPSKTAIEDTQGHRPP